MSQTEQYNAQLDKKCPVTGFLENNVSSKAKTAFLKLFKTIGNQSAAADRQGFTWTEIEEELRKDLIFNKAYQEVLLQMKHELEGILYCKAISRKDTKSALMWLSAKFPEEYRAGAKKKEKKDNKEALFDSLLDG